MSSALSGSNDSSNDSNYELSDAESGSEGDSSSDEDKYRDTRRPVRRSQSKNTNEAGDNTLTRRFFRHNQPFVKWMSAQLPDVYILPDLSLHWSEKFKQYQFLDYLNLDDRFKNKKGYALQIISNEVQAQVQAGVRTFVVAIELTYPTSGDGHVFNVHVHLSADGTAIDNIYSLDTGIFADIRKPKKDNTSWTKWTKEKVFGQTLPVWEDVKNKVGTMAYEFNLYIVLSTIFLYLFDNSFSLLPEYMDSNKDDIFLKPPPDSFSIEIVRPFSDILRTQPRKFITLNQVMFGTQYMLIKEDSEELYEEVEQIDLLQRTLLRLFENNWNMWRAVQSPKYLQEGEDVGFCNTWIYFLSYLVLKCEVPLNELFPRVMAIQQPFRKEMIRKWRNEALNPSAELRFGEPEEYRTMVTQLNSALTDMGFPPNDSLKTRFQAALQETKNELNNVQTLQSQNPGISFAKEMSTYQQRLRDLEILFEEFQQKDEVKKLLFDTKVKPFDLCSLDAAERKSEVMEEKKQYEAFERATKRRKTEAFNEGYAGNIGGGFFFLL